MNADTLLDRIYLKSQITKWRLLAVVFAVLALVAAFSRFSDHSPIEGDYVARLSFEGVVWDDQDIYDLIDDVAQNPRAKAVILWLDTPGGSAVGGEEIFLRLRQLAQKKPVVAVMRSVSASAGYMIALGADQIFAREGTITGSIGVMIQSAEVTELADRLGIKPVIVKSAPLKGTPSFVEKTTPAARAAVQAMIDDFYNRFIDMVANRRQLPRDTVVTLADGRIYSGRAAVHNKLIDAIGGEPEAMNWLEKQKKLKVGLPIKDVKPNKKTGLLEDLAQTMSGKFFTNSSIGLDGLNAIWHPSLY